MSKITDKAASLCAFLAKKGDRFITFVDVASISLVELDNKIEKAFAELEEKNA